MNVAGKPDDKSNSVFKLFGVADLKDTYQSFYISSWLKQGLFSISSTKAKLLFTKDHVFILRRYRSRHKDTFFQGSMFVFFS